MLFRRRLPSAAELSDAELLKRYYVAGDLADLGVLYDRYLLMVFAICRRYLRPDEEAEDAVMQIFEELVVKLRHYEVVNFSVWLHSLVRNYCLTLLRAQQRTSVASGPRVEYFSDTADIDLVAGRYFTEDDMTSDSLAMEQQLQKLEQGLAELPTGQRRCLELFFLEKKCYRDISQETGFDLQQVKSYLQNGKRNLKRYLESTTPSAIFPHGRR